VFCNDVPQECVPDREDDMAGRIFRASHEDRRNREKAAGSTAKEKYCYNILYNSLPLGLLQESAKVQNLGIQDLRLNFTTESPAQAGKILQEFLDVYLHHKIPAERNYTKGHFKRGAE
jgi:hypothetical protein